MTTGPRGTKRFPAHPGRPELGRKRRVRQARLRQIIRLSPGRNSLRQINAGALARSSLQVRK
ncbi:unnamed protein product [Ciceribacter sp. T2.26MG-112.2]|nr:unnamed protein product [Ciceribacter naphthalenivorans]